VPTSTDSPATIFLSRSQIFGNEDTGVWVGGTVYSYRDNRIHANLTDPGGDGPVLTAPLQ
jgi:hypothetical protein